ncbi:hypothetical protein C1645_838868 [Glomus cerebriforme]|uniref:HTH myb-type domain-containing protein n=1 Tax=Glomus cerebriforme TaxID=658196 RepID=A0A397S2Z7_9GLOM|nr:hypothetical protein C1645_838868 [Glomus cerebriforme]
MRFNPESDEIILDCMYLLKKMNVRNKYERISKILPQYQSRQIRHHYCNNLDERLSKDPLSNDEKEFITQWVKENQEPNGTIHWRDLIPEMEYQLGKLHSENKIKNFWYPRRFRRDGNVRIPAQARPINSINNTPYFNFSFPLPQIPTPSTIEPNFQPNNQFKAPNRMEPF